jgi:hypothetical protein
VLVTGRTQRQCDNRWHDLLAKSIDRASELTGGWAEDEDTKLKDAVQTHGYMNGGAIAVLVTGQTIRQCYNRWHDLSDASIDQASERSGKCAKDEDIKVKYAVKTHDTGKWAEDEVS